MLTEILKQNPGDAFTRYGLAMAYSAAGRLDEALREFATTIEKNPDYVPAYQMSAQELIKADRLDEARVQLKAGLAVAERTHNAKATSEMSGMLDDIS
ncbi:MAG: tetratricopeptide repeat protein [Bryocella sp.]